MRGMPEMGRVREICEAVRAAGGRTFLVGGLVRDALRTDLFGFPIPEPRDIDLECFGISADRLLQVLRRFGRIDTVGESFTVYKIGEIDVSIPRRDSKTGPGHRGFTVTGDPYMTVEEATRRRDFTVNAILWDPLTDEILDPFGGVGDISARRLRVVDPHTFIEDSLRVLRAIQFAARFEFVLDPDSRELCRAVPLDDLPHERIRGEMEKLLLWAARPSIGLALALDLLVVQKLFPELAALVGCPQDPEWHAEGDVWVHTLQVVDQAAALRADLPYPQQLTLMLGALCHDLGKPATTKLVDGRVRAFAHEPAGLEPTLRLLERLHVNSADGYDVRGQVLAIVANHLKPANFHSERERIGDGAFRRLALQGDLNLLTRVARADALGRELPSPRQPDDLAVRWFEERVFALGLQAGAPAPLLQGRHLLGLGVKPGPAMGEVLREVYEMQLDGGVADIDSAQSEGERIARARGLLKDER